VGDLGGVDSSSKLRASQILLIQAEALAAGRGRCRGHLYDLVATRQAFNSRLRFSDLAQRFCEGLLKVRLIKDH